VSARLLVLPFSTILGMETNIAYNPKTYDGATRRDEARATFAEIKPLGYWPTRVA
jgi:hypothetical protein